jgi:ABC-type uncharacterized transport system substrate-binding protein
MTEIRDQKSEVSKNIKEKFRTRNSFCIALFALLLALRFTADAQQPTKFPRVGYLSNFDPASESSRAEAFRRALRDLGYIDGQNIVFEYRYTEGKVDRLPGLAAELVRLKVDIIVVAGGDPLISAAKNATKTIPIVMSGGGSILSRQVWLKALPVPAATSRDLQTLAEI